MAKRAFDIIFSLAGIVFFLPVFILAAAMVKFFGGVGPVFFSQERIGRDFKPFKLYKFRSMRESEGGPPVTISGDKRITGVGRILRKYKADELPQLINVLKGEMSFVGPRPEIKKYVELFKPEYEGLLRARPGITDPASIWYADEESVLAAASSDWEHVYVSSVLPEKIRLSSEYADGRKNMFTDLKLIAKTLFRIGGKTAVFPSGPSGWKSRKHMACKRRSL